MRHHAESRRLQAPIVLLAVGLVGEEPFSLALKLRLALGRGRRCRGVEWVERDCVRGEGIRPRGSRKAARSRGGGIPVAPVGKMKNEDNDEKSKRELDNLAYFANSASSFPLSRTLSTLVCSEVETETDVFLKQMQKPHCFKVCWKFN